MNCSEISDAQSVTGCEFTAQCRWPRGLKLPQALACPLLYCSDFAPDVKTSSQKNSAMYYQRMTTLHGSRNVRTATQPEPFLFTCWKYRKLNLYNEGGCGIKNPSCLASFSYTYLQADHIGLRPHGIRYEMSSPSQTLGRRVRISIRACMSRFILCFVILCRQRPRGGVVSRPRSSVNWL